MSNKWSVVIIPTIGAPTLATAIESVLAQTHSKVEPWVIIDGPEYEDKARKILVNYPKVRSMCLISNTGGSGFYGHRINAAVSYLVDHDYLSYLDQDNFFLPNHIETVVNACEVNNWHWCHSLRKIYDVDGNYICDDNCESLGKHPVFSNDYNLVDTSTYCIRREVMINLAPAWYSGWGGDRVFYAAISKHVPNFGCTNQHTVGYRVDGNPGSVKGDFFKHGNAIMTQRYPGGFPWNIE